jgi:hypothetical protein
MLLWAGGAASLIPVAILTAFALRGPIGERTAIAYLRARGVPAQVRVERLDTSGFSGGVVVGDPSDPDLAVERMEVVFEPGLLWRDGQLAPRIRSVHLVQPRLKLGYDGRRLTFGALQPLISALKPSAAPGRPPPDIQIEQAQVRLKTPAGTVVADGDAIVTRGRLRSLSARILPARLAYRGFLAEIVSGQADAWSDDRLHGAVGLKLGRAVLKGAEIQGAVIGVGASSPASRVSDGRTPLTLAVDASAASGRNGEVAIREPAFKALFQGTVAGPPSALRADGVGRLTLQVPSAAMGGGQGRGASLDLALPQIRLLLGRRAELRLASEGQASLDRLDLGLRRAPVQARAVSWRGKGELELAGDQLAAHLHGGLAALGGADRAGARRLAAALPLLGSDPEAQDAAASFLADAALSAPDLDLALAEGRLRLVATRRISLSAPAGRSIVLSPRSGAAILALDSNAAQGAFDLAVGGAGLPQLQATVLRYRGRSRGGGTVGDADLAFNLAVTDRMLTDARFKAAGRLSLTGAGRMAFSGAGCAAGSARAVSNGGRRVLEDVSGQLCPAPGAPLVRTDGAGWRLSAEARGVQARALQLNVKVSEGAGVLNLSSGRGRGLGGEATVRRLVLAGLSPEPLFRPLQAEGRLSASAGVVEGRLQVAELAHGQAIGQLTLHQDLGSGAGTAQISAPNLRFDPQGLQPAQVFPIAGSLATQASGRASFTGWARWSRSGMTSGGELRLDPLDFRSPMGRVQGLVTDVHFDSLLPLTTPPGQHAAAGTIHAVTMLSNDEADFSIGLKSLEIQGARAEAAGGGIEVGRLSVPFVGDHATSGVLRFKGVDVGAMLEGSSFADKISAQAKVDGEVRFSASTAGFHILSGQAFATGPGRLSIRRAALTGVAGEGASAPAATSQGANPQAAPSPMQDLAYQALEDLAFEKFDAVIEPRPKGRLGMVFHITGRHDPAQAPKATIGLLDILRGQAFKKRIPLPKGTPINLTLDTSINFDELVHDYMAATSQGSAEVQP